MSEGLNITSGSRKNSWDTGGLRISLVLIENNSTNRESNDLDVDSCALQSYQTIADQAQLYMADLVNTICR